MLQVLYGFDFTHITPIATSDHLPAFGFHHFYSLVVFPTVLFFERRNEKRFFFNYTNRRV